jgi:hypothetical protein
MEEQLCFGDVGKMDAVEQAFLEALLHAEGVSYTGEPGDTLDENAFQVAENPDARVTYPWNPLSPEAEAFLADSQDSSIFAGWQDEDIAHRSQSFFKSLDQVWVGAGLAESLAQRFAARVPQNWLTTIAQYAQKVVTEAQQTVSQTSNLLADQLVQCVREVAPGLAEEDFYVLARPLAIQMRNGGMANAIDSVIAQVPQVEWEQLSDVQRARLGLAIARYAIGELQTAQDA